MTDDDIDTKMAKYEGNFLESSDLMHSPPVTVVIADVKPPNTEKSADGRKIDKPILVFEKATKWFVCGKTNIRILKAWHGKKPSSWIGRQVTIGVRYLKAAFGESNVPTLRIIPPNTVPLPMSARKWFGRETPYPTEEK